MFPGGAPGVALLVLRLCLAASLARLEQPNCWQHVVFLILLAMLSLGLFTPVVCVVTAAIVFVHLLHFRNHDAFLSGIIIFETLALAFLGPGAYSVDSRLFGRRMVVSVDSSRRDS
jgi:hypothetical protein